MLDVHPTEWREKWTSLVPGGRFCEAAELKGSYVFLASDASSYMTGMIPLREGGGREHGKENSTNERLTQEATWLSMEDTAFHEQDHQRASRVISDDEEEMQLIVLVDAGGWN